MQEFQGLDILNCPVANVQKIIRGKWTMVIIYFLCGKTLSPCRKDENVLPQSGESHR